MHRDGQGNFILSEVEYIALQDHDTEAYKALAYERLGEIVRISGQLGRLKDWLRWRDARTESPEEGQTCLVCYRGLVIIAIWRLENEFGKWERWTFSSDLLSDGNSYWMPLPSAPEIVRVIDKIRLTGVSLNADGSTTAMGQIEKQHTEVRDAKTIKTEEL